MNDIATRGPPTAEGTPTDAAREAWAAERRRLERGRHWVSPAGPRSRWRGRLLHLAIRGFGWALGIAGFYGHGRRNALAPALVELELTFPALPAAFDGYRILQLSDTHLDALPELGAIAGRLLDGIAVDLVALTGDILGRHGTAPERATAPLAQVLAGVAVRDRRLAVLGNHDPATMAEALETAGFEVLLNRSIAIERDGERLLVIGLDDVHCFYTPAARAALFAHGDAGFRIALVHSAEMADHANAAGIALYLCGHTHGGQICLPAGRPLITQLIRCRHGARGLWRDGATVGYKSRGLGVSGPLVRFNCPGEATLVTLRRGHG
jgi:predicted MPP superfamily phosphohydrolase